MLSCKEVTEICSREMEQPLKLGEKMMLRAHLMMCAGCTNYRKQMETLRQVMRAYAEGGAATSEDPEPDQDAKFPL